MKNLFGLFKTSRITKATFAAVLLGGILAGGFQLLSLAKPAAEGPAVVVLTASWCGTCREITPVVQRIISGSPNWGLKLVTLDVDQANAPDQAGAYGITVSGSEVPQVYLYQGGKTVLLFNGKNYRFGQSHQAEAQIRSKIEGSL